MTTRKDAPTVRIQRPDIAELLTLSETKVVSVLHRLAMANRVHEQHMEDAYGYDEHFDAVCTAYDNALTDVGKAFGIDADRIRRGK